MRMAGMHYSTASYLTHVIKGLTSSYNLLKRLTSASSTRVTPNKDSLTLYLLQEAERPSKLLAQVNYVAPVKQGGRPGQRRQSGGGGSSGWKPTNDADKKKLAKDSGRGGGSRRRECWLNQPHKEKQLTKSSTSEKNADSSAGGKGRDDKEASSSLVSVVEPTSELASEASEDFQAMAAAVQANPAGVQGRGTVALQGEAGRQVLIPDVSYVPGVRANLLLAGQLKENGVKLQEDGDQMLLVSAARDILGRASYTRQVLCTDLRPCSAKSTTPSTEVVALRAIVSMTKSTLDRLHARLAYVGMNTIRSSANHEVATGLDLKSASGADLPCVSCVGGKLARHTFPDQGSDADDVLVVRGGKLKPKARWGLHLGVSEESKGWELFDIADNQVVTTSDVVFYENMSLEVWKSEHGPASGRTPTIAPTDTSTASLPLLAEVGERATEDVEDVPSPFPSPALRAPPIVADWRGLNLVSASGDEGRSGTSPLAPVKSDAGGRRDEQQVKVGVKSMLIGEEQAEEVQPTLEKPAKKAPVGQQPTGEQAAVKPTTKPSATRHSEEGPTTGEKSARKPAEVQQNDEGNEAEDDGGDAKETTDSDVVEVQRGPRQSGRIRRPPDFYVPAAFATAYDEVDDNLQYDDAEEDEDFPELDLDMHANLEHCWDILTMIVKEALASWKGKAVKAAMEEETCSLVGIGTWELVECPPGVNIMKNRWVLTTKYHIDDTVERDKARLVVKGFTQVYGANYDETYAPVSSYVTLRIFLSIAAVLDLNLMQLYMKNAFLQSKLNRVLYIYQPDYFNDGTGRVCKLLKSLYGLKKLPLLWYRALDGVLLSAGWKKGQVDTALYFKVGDDNVTCWISPVQKYLGLEIVCDRSVRKLWLHQQGYADNLRRRFLDEEQTRRTPKTPVSVDTYATLTFDDEEAQSLKLVGYVDANDAGDKQIQTSTVGYVFVFGGAAVSWLSQRIKCATLSSTKSEYVAATKAGKEGRRLWFLLAEFRQLDAGTPTDLWVDNKSAIIVAEGMGLSGNLKHMERRQAWLQHMVKRGKFSLRYIPTIEQPADFLTKALHYPAFNRCSVAIDVRDGDNDVQQ
ncbi:unnamed protein product [Closterium sp. NIES-54]